MKNNLSKIEKLLKSARSVSSEELSVDKSFKETLRGKLYREYLDQTKKDFQIWTKLKLIYLNKSFRFISFAFLSILVCIFALVNLVVKDSDKEVPSEGSKVIVTAKAILKEGRGYILKKDNNDWESTIVGQEIEAGDTVKTEEDSRLIIDFETGDTIRLNSGSEVKLESLDDSDITIEQIQGESFSRLVKLESRNYIIKIHGVECKSLGTTYIINEDIDNKLVNIYVFESRVKFEYKKLQGEVNELEKVQIKLEENVSEKSNLTEEEYKCEFALWNKSKDIEKGVNWNENEGPIITVYEPIDGISTENKNITIKGEVTKQSDKFVLKRLVLNDQEYNEMTDGKGFDKESGDFNIDISLSEGENPINIKAYDIYWNEGREVNIKVIRTIPRFFYISNISSPERGKIYVKWAINNIQAPYGVKVIWAYHTDPIYPEDESILINQNEREANITELSGGAYYVRVCIYDGNVGCSRYTENKSVIVKSMFASNIEVSVVNGYGMKSEIRLKLIDGGAPYGVKVIWSSTQPVEEFICFTFPMCFNYSTYSGPFSEGYNILTSDIRTVGSFYFKVCVLDKNGNKIEELCRTYGPVEITL